VISHPPPPAVSAESGLPVVALVGRPNVGKSTLFNQLTRSRAALVADLPGLTRDRQYGVSRTGDRPFIVVDTGGLSGEAAVLDEGMRQQTLKAIDEADVIVLIGDARAGITAADEAVAELLRPVGKPVVLAVNKIDGVNPDVALAEWHALGLGEPFPLAASHRHGVAGLAERLGRLLPEQQAVTQGPEGMRIAVVGRPNVGKSTLINRLLGEDRLLASPIAGTTRDSIYVPLEREGVHYTLIDTAGVRRRGRVDDKVEKFSVIKTLDSIEAANVVVFLVDAREGVVDQDLHLVGEVIEAGRALVLAVNKWDGLSPEERERVRAGLDRRLSFARFAELFFISALHGSNVGLLLAACQRAYDAGMANLSTNALTQGLQQALAEHQPPVVKGRRIKLRYAHQGGRNPPVIVIHGKQTESVPGSYLRYLETFFRERFNLFGTPLRIELRTDANPYDRG